MSPTSSSYRPLTPPGHPHLLLILHHLSPSVPPTTRRLPAALAAPPAPLPHHPVTSHHQTRPPPPESPLAPARPPIPNNLNPNLGATAISGDNRQPVTLWRPRHDITPPTPPLWSDNGTLHRRPSHFAAAALILTPGRMLPSPPSLSIAAALNPRSRQFQNPTRGRGLA
jgi:hypothetical protein